MDFNATIDLIIKDLDETCNIIDDLKNYPDVPAFQVELAKSKCRNAGEVIALLKTLKNSIPEVKEISSETENDLKLQQPVIEEKTEKKEEHIQEKATLKKEAEKPIIADKFSHLSGSFNEQLGNKKGEDDMSERLNIKHITNLSEAIGINDRFLFIREIFNGNGDAYKNAILQLDNVKNMTDARSVLMSYTDESDDNKAVKQLFDLVKRKLPSNE